MYRGRCEEWRCLPGVCAVLGCISLTGCSGMANRFMDETAFVVQPSRHEVVLAYAFGGGNPVAESASVRESHHLITVADAVAEADHTDSGLVDGLRGIDYRSGLLYLRVPRRAAGTRYTLFKNPMTCEANASGVSICRK